MKFDDNLTPALETRHVAPDARLFANRHDLIASLKGRPFGAVAEVGVGLGDFSLWIISNTRPASFWAFDVFTMHDYPEHWGRTSQEIFQGKTHRQYYEAKLAGESVELHTVEGLAVNTLPAHTGPLFDLIYIDASHSYEDVKIDADNSARILTDNGIIIFNDYVMYDPFLETPYGVVKAVNEFMQSGAWEIVGFAFQNAMFCDIAVRRKGRSGGGSL